MDFDIVFLMPEKFEDTKKIVEHIKQERIVHINLVNLDTQNRQRILDFISGAAFIQEARLVQPGEAVYCTVPLNKLYYQEGTTEKEESDVMDLRFDEEEEIKPIFT